MDVTVTVWYLMGVIFLLLLLHLLAKPAALMLRLVGNSLVGGVVLWVVNLGAGLAGFHIGLNPLTAAVVGVLGAPGLLGLGLLRWIFA